MANTEHLYVVAMNGDVQISPYTHSENIPAHKIRAIPGDNLSEPEPQKVKGFGMKTLIFRTTNNQKLEKRLRAEERLGILCQNI
jgi:hypothetical protein